MRVSRLVAFAAIIPILTAANEPIRLQPSSPWVLDYAENSCRLIRTFGEGKAKTILAFESDAPDEMDMLAVGKPLQNYTEEVRARFLPVGVKVLFVGQSALSTDKGDPALLWSNVLFLPDELAQKHQREMVERAAKPAVRPPPINLNEQADYRSQRQQFSEKVTELEIQTRRDRPVILETGRLGQALRMFDKCSRDSLTDWGVDPSLEEKIVRPTWAANPAKWFSSDDYPRSMLFRGEESEVSVRLLVDATGKVTKCTSLSHFKEPEFNKITCDVIMKRAKLAPAELANGTTVPSYYTQRVKFRIAH